MADNTNKTLIVLIAMMMVCSLMVNPTNTTPISYGAMGADTGNICKNGNCKTTGNPVNEYNRGCEPEARCRNG